MRELFRSTAVHQTLTLNGENSARSGKMLQWEEDDGQGNASVTVENAAYPDLTHRRTVFFVARKYFVLLDEALGSAQGKLDLHFQLTPGPVVIDPATNEVRTAFSEGGNVLVWADPAAPVTIEAEQAWFSPEYNKKEPLPAFRCRHTGQEVPVRFLTVLVPFEGSAVPKVRCQVTQGEIGGNQVQVMLEVNNRTYHFDRRIKGRDAPAG